ncbi:hypothetical protein K435DRAFT_809667 [Dendrothele bispora CBS 962.96]|uniref:DUF6532 domain-containing protein n=1 Tax=Dendrothele bispora (strain CBS 962.96) TaxID=1314807 RepID=A0A4S8KXG8_DENBC|nr:hypothetical protein K435DRAFT_809667 [Dendrothele bispora CBS 962.96]
MAPRRSTKKVAASKETDTVNGKRKSTITQDSDVSSKRLKTAKIDRAADAKAAKALAAAKKREAASAAKAGSASKTLRAKPPKPISNTRKRGHAPVICSESEEETEPELMTKAAPKISDKPEDRQEDESEDEEEADDQEDDDRGADLDAELGLEDEAPRMIRGGGKKTTNVTAVSAHGSDLSDDEDDEDSQDRYADLTSVPLTSDGEGFDWDEVPEHAPEKRNKTSSRSAEKLAEELPLVTTRHGTSVPAGTPSDNESSDDGDNEADNEEDSDEDWLLHTNILLQPFTDTTHTFKLSLSGQNLHIKAVIKEARKLGSLQMLTNATYCPLDQGIKSIATASLIDAALGLNYDEPLDIADRLQHGDFTRYISPLTRYVTQRITIERRSLKTGFTATVLSAFGIDNSQEGISVAADLVRNSDYIYPPHGDGFDYQKPFGHKVIHAYMALVYFGKTKLAKALDAKRTEIFVSSISEKPLELELPKAMVVMAACVIHAILQDHAYSSEEHFPPPGLASQWLTYMEILAKIEKKSCMVYHRLMHDLYLKASHTIAPATHGLSRQDIINRINWDAFTEDDNDATSGGSRAGVDVSSDGI